MGEESVLAPSHTPSALLPIGYSRPLSARHLVRPVLLLSSNHRPPCLGGPPTTCRNDPHGPVVLPLRRPLLLSLSLEILHFLLFLSYYLLLVLPHASSHTTPGFWISTSIADPHCCRALLQLLDFLDFCSRVGATILPRTRVQRDWRRVRSVSSLHTTYLVWHLAILLWADLRIYFYSSATTPELLRAIPSHLRPCPQHCQFHSQHWLHSIYLNSLFCHAPLVCAVVYRTNSLFRLCRSSMFNDITNNLC
ncbi:hypothetical protein BDV40DRAFT_238061 [Aspergillus tamarii]|uniref:Uncharacterized protein n=1 Tax=Aspergillus tamarii TaxID=41984 RepID=A0A5N6V6C9_ASPTM|nr:hypothetical protein BDV40DRAFT_238061 [Aspergillus tamarii]